MLTLCRQEESPTGSPSPCPTHSDDELQSPSRASSSLSSSPAPAAELGEEELKDKGTGPQGPMPRPLNKPSYEKPPPTSQPLSINRASPAFGPFLLAEGLSSMETLLTNIQVKEMKLLIG